MLRTILIAAALGAIALPAAATTQITVNVAGQDAKTAHATIVHAAEKACRTELRDSSTFEQYYLRPDCISNAVTQAEATLANNTATASASDTNTAAQGRLSGR
jgi:hypothetical protein